MIGAREKRLISVRAFVELKRYEGPTLMDYFTRKYWINLSKIIFVCCLDTCLCAYKRISCWDYSKCLKKLVQNGFRTVLLVDLTGLGSSNKNW